MHNAKNEPVRPGSFFILQLICGSGKILKDIVPRRFDLQLCKKLVKNLKDLLDDFNKTA